MTEYGIGVVGWNGGQCYATILRYHYSAVPVYLYSAVDGLLLGRKVLHV